VDIITRDAHDGAEFVMTVGGQVFAGKGAREEAAGALARAVFSTPRRLQAPEARHFQELRNPEQGSARSIPA
jgi:hypothetical protein